MVIASTGLIAWWLRRSHRAELERRLAAGTGFDEDADVVLHVALHEARARRHPWVTSVHVLYGLLQDEAVVAALRDSGADPDLLEDRVLAALDGHEPSLPSGREGGAMLGYARAVAEQSGRRAGTTDLWAALVRGGEAAALCDGAGVDRPTVLFRLFHGEEPSIGERLTGELDVVLRNDHWTTKEFVCEVLEDVFTLDHEVAVARMEGTHEQGTTVVGRYRAAEARAKVLEARRRAHASGFPLWVGVAPA